MAKRILLGVLITLILIQFIRPQPNASTQPAGKEDFIVCQNPPPDIRDTLRHACYDCHSNTTRYPWYAQIQPVGWWLANHVNGGKHALNFSIFGTYDKKRQAKKLDQIADQVTNHDMPLGSYTWIHRDARLSEGQIRALSDWADALHDQIAPKD
jgi:hypothetical protein